MTDYRARIYERYLSVSEGAAPSGPGHFAPRRAYFQRLIGNHFPSDKAARITELGCGHGALMHFAQGLGYTDMEGIDGSAEQVETAARVGVRNVRHGDLMTALREMEPGSRDAIVAFDVLEHFRRDEILDFVDRVWAVLKPGGRFILHVPNAESLFGARMRYYDLTHEIAFTPHSIKQLGRVCGFDPVEVFEDRPAVHGLKSGLRYLAWAALRSLLGAALTAETGDSGRRAVFSQNMLAVAHRAERPPPAGAVAPQ